MATLNATMPATFSVPARLPRSCAPPEIKFGKRMPRRTYKAPTPLEHVIYVRKGREDQCFLLFTLIFTLPTVCTASVWNSTPCFCKWLQFQKLTELCRFHYWHT